MIPIWQARPIGAEAGPLERVLQDTLDAAVKRRRLEMEQGRVQHPTHVLISDLWGHARADVLQEVYANVAAIAMARQMLHRTVYRWPLERAALLTGGSIYYAHDGIALLRLPIRALEVAAGGRAVRLVLAPTVYQVEARRVGGSKHWRELSDGDAPPDLPVMDPPALEVSGETGR